MGDDQIKTFKVDLEQLRDQMINAHEADPPDARSENLRLAYEAVQVAIRRLNTHLETSGGTKP